MIQASQAYENEEFQVSGTAMLGVLQQEAISWRFDVLLLMFKQKVSPSFDAISWSMRTCRDEGDPELHVHTQMDPYNKYIQQIKRLHTI